MLQKNISNSFNAPAFTYNVTPDIYYPFRNLVAASGDPLRCSIVKTPYSENITSFAAGRFMNECCYNVSAYRVQYLSLKRPFVLVLFVHTACSYV